MEIGDMRVESTRASHHSSWFLGVPSTVNESLLDNTRSLPVNMKTIRYMLSTGNNNITVYPVGTP
jgi:hypothetical protein